MKRTFSPQKSEETELHGAFLPADVRPGEGIRCFIKTSGREDFSEFLVWRLSPFGVEVIQNDMALLTRGEKIVVRLAMKTEQTILAGSVVEAEMQVEKKKICAIRLETSPQAEVLGSSVDQRGSTRWQSHRLFVPVGSAVNKFRFGDRILFRVADISANGLGLITSLRNKHFQIGQQVVLDFQLPSVGEVTLEVQVARIGVRQTAEGPQQILGVKMLRPSHNVMALLGQYILQFGGDDSVGPTPKKLAEEGFYVQSIAGALDYDIVRTDEQYRQVLELRSLAFKGVQGLGVSATPEQMADVYDARSRILICQYRKRVVATTRLCFHGPNDRFEEEEYVSFPANFPPREMIVEASRAATHPDFRGSDLFLNIFRYVMLVTLQSGRRWIVQSTYGGLVPIYERVGFRRTGLRCPHPVFPGEKLHLLLGDCQKVLNGQVGSVLTWNTLVPEIRHLLDDSNQSDLNWFSRKRLALYEAFTPLYRVYEKARLRKRMRRYGLR